mmetsp:Transcript_49257/g.127050  ORF Transcript_49257/g.127050 Transcript_49257/m.127050 type:complete len:496 (-) Transcript_49257:770-2257(-)|eukprot:CAMPEP_0113887948 /NCGR_PEP_ID=MMETSP0780_2-20120614/12546_1 /TAXON_ID=652834 /ORGANISM="Palpitomonas bilix" /LENGTH=495 /DNA_ID=CAMNT_0000876635 /DNA_START=66 /DNA_END=1553 /DNA_ORIENTATION=+ /assembly_acc=CAM_ASM_000599
MSITSDEVNYLVYRYLQESGFQHSSFTFGYESNIRSCDIDPAEVAPGSLISFLQKGLQYLQIETEIKADGSIARSSDEVTLLQLKKARETIEKRSRETEETPEEDTSSTSRTADEGTDKGKEAVSDQAPMEVEDEKPLNMIPPSQVNRLVGHKGEVFMGDFHPKKNVFLTGCSDGTARIWDLDKVKDGVISNPIVVEHKPRDGSKADIPVVEWNGDGSLFATSAYDGTLRIFDEKANEIHKLRKHDAPVFSMRWNRRGDYVLTGSVDKKTIVWDAKSGSVRQEFRFHQKIILDVDWRNNNSFASCSLDGMIYICKVGQDEPLKQFSGHTDEVNVVQWDPSGRLLASCSDDSTVRIWNLQEDESIMTLKGHHRGIYTIKWRPKRKDDDKSDSRADVLASASIDNSVKVWDVSKGKAILDLKRHKDPVYSIDFSPCGNFLASGSFDHKVHIWSMKDGSIVKSFECPSFVYDVRWNRDGDKVAACCATGGANMIDFRM